MSFLLVQITDTQMRCCGCWDSFLSVMLDPVSFHSMLYTVLLFMTAGFFEILLCYSRVFYTKKHDE